jgi:hypothetical protein
MSWRWERMDDGCHVLNDPERDVPERQMDTEPAHLVSPYARHTVPAVATTRAHSSAWRSTGSEGRSNRTRQRAEYLEVIRVLCLVRRCQHRAEGWLTARRMHRERYVSFFVSYKLILRDPEPIVAGDGRTVIACSYATRAAMRRIRTAQGANSGELGTRSGATTASILYNKISQIGARLVLSVAGRCTWASRPDNGCPLF